MCLGEAHNGKHVFLGIVLPALARGTLMPCSELVRPDTAHSGSSCTLRCSMLVARGNRRHHDDVCCHATRGHSGRVQALIA
eukprot:505062-Rhodomonas_salina.2